MSRRLLAASFRREDEVLACANPERIFGLFTRKEGKFLVAPKSLE